MIALGLTIYFHHQLEIYTNLILVTYRNITPLGDCTARRGVKIMIRSLWTLYQQLGSLHGTDLVLLHVDNNV